MWRAFGHILSSGTSDGQPRDGAASLIHRAEREGRTTGLPAPEGRRLSMATIGATRRLNERRGRCSPQRPVLRLKNGTNVCVCATADDGRIPLWDLVASLPRAVCQLIGSLFQLWAREKNKNPARVP
jgi:hypothetical protein